jgi:hypothetical protein
MKTSVLFLLACGSAFAGSRSELRMDPHYYADPRGQEPNGQLNALVAQRWGNRSWEVRGHLEVEAQGRRDLSLDLDRAWYGADLGANTRLVLGRAHLWELGGYPGADDVWGLAAQRVSQNRGLLLGYGFDAGSPAPRPMLLGWVGAHFTTNPDRTLSLGVSATPFFLPDVGPDLTLSPVVSAARFARRPPGYLEVQGRRYPLAIEVARSRIWQDVVLNPQAMAFFRVRESEAANTWLVITRAPSPNPSLSADGFLRVREDGISAVAQVQPRFEQRIDLAITQTHALSFAKLHATAFVSTDRAWGAEVGTRSTYLDVSVLKETLAGSASSVTLTQGRYTDLLLQAEARAPLASILFFAGLKTHPKQNDAWARAGVRLPLDREMTLDLGGDWFDGPDDSYFGEWRSNRRVSAALQWGLGV